MYNIYKDIYLGNIKACGFKPFIVKWELNPTRKYNYQSNKLLVMTVDDKKRLVKKISESLTMNKLENTLTENGDNYILAISQIDVPKDGIHHEHMRRIVNTSNFRSMKIGQFNLIFIFDISEPNPIVPE